MSWPFRIALRYLKSKKAHNAVNIISIISVLGVVVTTAALVCVLSVFNGFRGVIMGRLAKLDPEIAVVPAMGKTIADADSVISAVKAVQGVDMALPTLEDNALAVFVDYQMPVRLKGVPPEFNRISDIDSCIVDGTFSIDDGVSQYAVIGPVPAINLHLRAGYLRMLQFYAPQRVGSVNLANPMEAFRNDSLFVSGIFQLEQHTYDDDLILVPLDFARNLFDYTTEASDVEILLKPGANEAAVMHQLQAVLGPSYMVKNRLMQQSEAYRLVNIEKWIAFLLVAFILLIATFNVISTLSLLIIEKDESIRTLRNLGADNKMITRIFVIEGWLIALLGAVSGVVLGVLLSLGQEHFGWLKLQGDPALMTVTAYPVQVVWTDVVISFAFVALIGLITSLVTSLIMRSRLRAK